MLCQLDESCECLSNALTGQGPIKFHISGKATYRDLAGWSEDNFRVADDSLRIRRTVSPTDVGVCSANLPATNRGRLQRTLMVR